jgi:hypothetical protein
VARLRADRIEVSRDKQQHNWLLRIWIGDEVIRRHCNDPENADAEVLRASAIKTANDEGYEIDPSNVVLNG